MRTHHPLIFSIHLFKSLSISLTNICKLICCREITFLRVLFPGIKPGTSLWITNSVNVTLKVPHSIMFWTVYIIWAITWLSSYHINSCVCFLQTHSWRIWDNPTTATFTVILLRESTPISLRSTLELICCEKITFLLLLHPELKPRTSRQKANSTPRTLKDPYTIMIQELPLSFGPLHLLFPVSFFQSLPIPGIAEKNQTKI